MSVNTRHPVPRRKNQQSVVLVGANGLPIEGILSISGARHLIENTSHAVTYDNGTGTVTVDASYDLQALRDLHGKYTGRLIYIDPTSKATEIYFFIDILSIDNTAKTFKIYLDPDQTLVPQSINTEAGWIIAEAQLVNRLGTTSVAKIDQLEFRGFDVQLGLDGRSDSVSIRDGDDKLTVNPDGSINVNCNIDATDGDTIAISRHQYPFNYTEETVRTKAQLDTEAFTTIFTYTATQDDLRVGIIKVAANTFGEFRVKRGSDVLDYFRTSNMDRNCKFHFTEHEGLESGELLTVEFIPERLYLNDYRFFLRLEGYIEQ